MTVVYHLKSSDRLKQEVKNEQDDNFVQILIYSNSPHAYTLDVGVTENGETVVIEVHDFFSCGLYGFLRTDKLPYMFWRWYFYYVKNFMK